MPLRDHFHPPLEDEYPFDSLHSNWATRLADYLGERLPPKFIAIEHTHALGSLKIDVATFERGHSPSPAPKNGNATATLSVAPWAPPVAPYTMPALYPDSFEVRIFSTSGGRTLVGAIELISPGNKDRANERRTFAAKCLTYFSRGVSVLIIDIVTDRKANLHNETMRLMQADERFLLSDAVSLYAVAYRPVRREDRPEIDFWPAPCAVGQPLPLLPLRLTGDLFVPVDFEATYEEALRRRFLT